MKTDIEIAEITSSQVDDGLVALSDNLVGLAQSLNRDPKGTSKKTDTAHLLFEVNCILKEIARKHKISSRNFRSALS